MYMSCTEIMHPEAVAAVRLLLIYIGDNPNREGLKETPERVLRSYHELFSGYQVDETALAKMLKVFEDGACDEIVLLKHISFVSFCEHHLLPFTGFAHIAYLPDKKVVGVSKLARILDVFSRRLQIQERISQQVTTAMDMYLKPRGSACILEATHECMTCRGVKKPGSVLVTSSVTGAFREDPSARAELFSLIRGCN